MSRRSFARAAWLLVAAALPLAAAAQYVPAAPPPPRSFGPDRTSTGVFTGVGPTEPGVACDAPADAGTPLTCEGFLAGFDGTLLEVTVRVPRTGRPNPLVVGMHGWGGSRGSTARFDAPLLEAGFTFLRYGARGFGGSWGQTNLADVDVEAADLRALVGQVVDDERLAADPEAVAVFGASYGGAHAWLAALEPRFTSPAGRAVAVRTVVPIAGWSDLLEALVPNGRPERAAEVAGAEKLSYVQALFFGGIRTRLDRPYPNYPEYLVRWNAAMTTNELPYDATPTGREVVDGLQGYRSIYWQEPFWGRVYGAAPAERVAVFALQGFTDDLFPPREAVRMYEALKAIDAAYPIALYLGDLGHPRASNRPEEVDWALREVVAWLRWHLQGIGTAPAYDVRASITGAPFAPEALVRAPGWAELSNATAEARFPGWRVVTSATVDLSGFQWDPLVLAACAELQPCPPAPPGLEVPGAVGAWEAPVSRFSAGELLVAGAPTLTAWVLTLAHRVQLDLRVLDVAPDGTRALVTRGTYTLDTGSAATPIRATRVTIPTNGNLWRLPADHRIRFEVTNVDWPYLRPSLVPSASLLVGAEVTLPVRR